MRCCSGLASLGMSLSGLPRDDRSWDRGPLPDRFFDPSQRSRSPDIWLDSIVDGLNRPLLPGTGSFLALAVAEHAVERPKPFATVGLLCQSLRPQQVGQTGVRADDAERHPAGCQLIVKIVQHARSRQIDKG